MVDEPKWISVGDEKPPNFKADPYSRNAQIMRVLTSSNRDDWETPRELFDKLNAVYHFTLDAAASESNHKCEQYFTAELNGLSQDWSGETVFVNPPYGHKETGEWTKKCYEESEKYHTTVVLLIPARTDRKSFHKYIYRQPGVTVDFLPGRLKFELNGEPVGTAPFPSMLVVFRRWILRKIEFRGKMVHSGTWIYGPLIIHPGGIASIVTGSGIATENYWAVHPETVGEYTGVCDMDGAAIYEGDIVQIENGSNGEIKFTNGCFWVECKEGRLPLWEWHPACKIIGNIHDKEE